MPFATLSKCILTRGFMEPRIEFGLNEGRSFPFSYQSVKKSSWRENCENSRIANHSSGRSERVSTSNCNEQRPLDIMSKCHLLVAPSLFTLSSLFLSLQWWPNWISRDLRSSRKDREWVMRPEGTGSQEGLSPIWRQKACHQTESQKVA